MEPKLSVYRTFSATFHFINLNVSKHISSLTTSNKTPNMVIDKKRKRADDPGKRVESTGANSKRQKSNAGKRVTSIDSLAWKTVDVPEMFDDAEGFYGLEEVEGVDIVRDGETVKFVCLSFPRLSMPRLLTHPGRCCARVGRGVWWV